MAFEVLQKGREEKQAAGADREVRALDKIIGQFGPDSTVRNGGDMQSYLTVLGAIHGALALRLENAPDDAVSARYLAAVRQDIINIGIRAGRCKGVPDGTYQNDEKSWKLAQAIKAAKQTMVECASQVGSQELLRSIAHAVLPSAMWDSIGERNPEAFAAFSKPGASPDIMTVLESRVAGSLQEVLSDMMERGTPEGVAQAILHLLKSAEYVKMDVPGSRGKVPDAPEPVLPPADPLPGPPGPPGPQGTGAPWAYNYAPVTVKNDFTEFMKHLDKPPLQLTDLRNLLNDSFERGYALGQSHALNTQQQKEISDLKEQLRIANTRLNLFAKGPDLVRVPRSSSDDNLNSTEQQDRDAAPQNDDREPLVRLDPSSPRDPRVPDLNRQQNQLDQQNRQDHQTIERSDQRVNNGGNGNGGPRDNNRAPEDEVDNTSRPVNRASNSRLPDDEALNRLDRNNQNNLEQRQRLGSTEQRLGNQRNEQNRHLQRDTLGNRSSNRQASPEADGGYQEYRHYLQSQGVDVGPLAPDPFRPTSTRFMLSHRPWDPVKGASRHRQLLPSDVANYVRERSANAGTPFIPSMTGKVGPVPQLQKTELQQAFDDFFSRSRVISPHTMKESPADSVTRPIVIEEAARATVPATPETPMTKGADAGRLSRASSISSLASTNSSSSGGAFEYGERIREGSRQSSARLPQRNGQTEVIGRASAATTLAKLARSIPSVPLVDTTSRERADLSLGLGGADRQRHDALRESIIFGAHTPRGEDRRQVTFSESQDPLADLNVDEVLESLMEGEQLQSGVAPFAEQFNASDLLEKEIHVDWSAPASPIDSRASSIAGEAPEELELAPASIDSALRRSHSGVSMDSGRGSPTLQDVDTDGDAQPPVRVADRNTASPKHNDVSSQRFQLIEELKQHQRQMAQ